MKMYISFDKSAYTYPLICVYTILQVILQYEFTQRDGTISFECISEQYRIVFKFMVQNKIVYSIIS